MIQANLRHMMKSIIKSNDKFVRDKRKLCGHSIIRLAALNLCFLDLMSHNDKEALKCYERRICYRNSNVQ